MKQKYIGSANLIFRWFLALMALFLLFGSVSVKAEVLGTPTSQKSTRFATGTVFFTNTFHDPAVGQQTEHYAEYTPNPEVVPILTNGASLYGKRTLNQANDFLKEQNIHTAIGINADFFSFQTGVPMSNLLLEGKIISADDSDHPTIGFRKDGTAFIGSMPLRTIMKTPEGEFTVECINKYRQPYALYLYTDAFADNTHAPGTGINIVLGNVSGAITRNNSITATVESIIESEGSVPIPDGKLVLSVDSTADESIRARITHLEVGDTVTFTTQDLSHDGRWDSVVYALGCLGGRLITNGQLDYKDETAAPRTAIGIRKDGTILFYTIDGRQSGYSFGVRKETLARRLLELGCVDAVNLDGGGSTSIGGVLPGTTDFKILNSPSDGGLRSCANFLFLQKTIAPDGIPAILNVSHWGVPILSGSSVQLRVESAYDKSYGPADVPDNIHYQLQEDAGTPAPNGQPTQVWENGYVIPRGNGDVYISATSGEAHGSTMLRVVATPESLKIYRNDTGTEIQQLLVEPNQTIDLSATAFWDGQAMLVDDESFTWRVVSDNHSIGEISSDGDYKASNNPGATGMIAVNAGLCTYEIPVTIHALEEEPSPSAFPVIDGSLTETSISAIITSANGRIPLENIRFTIDGKASSFQYNEETGIFYYAMNSETAQTPYHRFFLSVMDETGASSIRTFDYGTLSSFDSSFPDTKGHWAKDYIHYLATLGIVNGSDDGFFYPDRSMNRMEFAIMLCNYLDIDSTIYHDQPLPFIDTDAIPWWALDDIKAIYALGIMQGQLTDYGVEFNPYSDIKRLEYAISITRLLPKGLSKAVITAPDADDIPFWAKESMRTAVGQGILNGYPDGTLLPHRSVSRAEAVKILHTILGAGK